MKRSSLYLTYLALCLCGLSQTSYGQVSELKTLGNFDDWAAFAYQEQGAKVCFMSSNPKKQEGKFSKRGDVHLFITHRPQDKMMNVVQYIPGYSYTNSSPVTLTIGSKTFELFGKDDMAWAKEGQTDMQIIEAIKANSSLTVKGKSQKGTETIDTYSLKGSSMAYKTISKECGVKIEATKNSSTPTPTKKATPAASPNKKVKK